jgi:hypothetical protein
MLRFWAELLEQMVIKMVSPFPPILLCSQVCLALKQVHLIVLLSIAIAMDSVLSILVVPVTLVTQVPLVRLIRVMRYNAEAIVFALDLKHVPAYLVG